MVAGDANAPHNTGDGRTICCLTLLVGVPSYQLRDANGLCSRRIVAHPTALCVNEVPCSLLILHYVQIEFQLIQCILIAPLWPSPDWLLSPHTGFQSPHIRLTDSITPSLKALDSYDVPLLIIGRGP